MKKVIGLLILVMVFAFGFGAGQYFYEKGLTIPGLAMASSKPKVIKTNVVEFTYPNPKHRYSIIVQTDRPIDSVEIKRSKEAALYYK